MQNDFIDYNFSFLYFSKAIPENRRGVYYNRATGYKYISTPNSSNGITLYQYKCELCCK